MQKMLQQVMTAPGHIEFREAPVPAPNAGEVLVKIMKIGVCGSDIHVYHGEHPFTKYPVTQGHEVSGKIAALGEGVTGFAVGQKVTIEPQVYCGRCHPCTHGKYNLCEELRVMGFQTTGTASEYFAVDAGKVTPLPETMTYSEGAMIEPLAVTVHAVRRAGDVRGQKIAVLGAGPIGILLAQSAKALGAAQVLITDISTPRLELAKACGVDFAVNTKEHGFGEALAECFGPDTPQRGAPPIGLLSAGERSSAGKPLHRLTRTGNEYLRRYGTLYFLRYRIGTLGERKPVCRHKRIERMHKIVQS